MSDSSASGKTPKRPVAPFPSRRDLHGTRIPQKPANAPEPSRMTPGPAIPETPAVVKAEPAPETGSFPSRRALHGTTPLGAGHSATSQPVPPPVVPAAPNPVPQPEASAAAPRVSALSREPATPKVSDAEIAAAELAESTVVTSSQVENEASEPAVPLAPWETIVGNSEDTIAPPAQDDSETMSGFDRVLAGQMPAAALPQSAKPGAGPALPTANSDLFPQPGRRVSKKRRQGSRWVLALLVIIIVAAVAAALWFVGKQLGWFGAAESQESALVVEDYPGPGSGEAIVTIEVGDLGSDMAQKLFEAGVVKSPAAFTAAFDANPASGTIRPGTFTLKKEMSGAGAVAALLDETNRSANSVAVIPGQTVEQVIANMVEVGTFTRGDVETAMSDPAALGLPEVANGNYEGWLFPGSYEASIGVTPQQLLTQMIAGTVDFLETNGAPEEDWVRILTEASIIEREVVFTADMPKVARVIENRIDNAEVGGLLGMDSTVLYGVGKFSGVPTAADLKDDNPYNTRLHPGLPPAPIANPSQDAILAVLNPAEGDWLYFATVDLDSGETLFTSSFEEHTENQQRFAAWCEANPGRC